MSLRETFVTHIVHGIANSFKDLEESMNVLDPVQNHLLLLRNPTCFLDSFLQFAYMRIISNSLYRTVL